MMALSAHDLARETGSPMTEALLHYEQIIPEMLKLTQSCNDWYSNGAFFTHFFLLLYEVSLEHILLPARTTLRTNYREIVSHMVLSLFRIITLNT